jgi:hypothetical protein
MVARDLPGDVVGYQTDRMDRWTRIGVEAFEGSAR